MTEKPSSTLAVQGEIWLERGAQALGGGARISLLEAIGSTGSITGAAKAVGLSYKAAWDAIDAMNNLAAEPLVLRTTGGRGGGGTQLTPRALRLIHTFRTIEGEHRRFLARIGASIDGFDNDWRLIGRMAMRTSARNQFYGKVSDVRRGAVNDEVSIALAGGQTVVSIITRESANVLGLAVGSDAYALVKASSVLLMTGDDMASAPARLSARNQLAGKVASIVPGAVNAEVTVELPGGAVVAAIVTQESAARLHLTVGAPALALFKASSVIVGTDA